jgi:hypothetical protein
LVGESLKQIFVKEIYHIVWDSKFEYHITLRLHRCERQTARYEHAKHQHRQRSFVESHIEFPSVFVGAFS